ncbi:MAG TPA: hypothetical protein VGJ77_13750 [Gaiellaceae bacterium]
MRRAVPLLVAAALAAGCGGGGTPLSRPEFAAQGNAICRDLYRKLEAMPEPRDGDSLASTMEKARGHTEDAIDALDDLEPPETAKASFEVFLARVRDELALMEDVQDAAEENDLPKALRKANRGTRLDEQASAAAAKAGLKVCARTARR